MVDTMIVTIQSDGTAQHTLRDKFLNPYAGERREIQRVSEILHLTSEQGFYIKWLMEPFNGVTLTVQHVLYDLPIGIPRVMPRNYGTAFPKQAPALWGTYEEAVQAEIEILDYYRSKGVVFS